MKIILSIIISSCIGFSSSAAHVGISYPSGDEELQSGSVITIKWYIEVDHGDCLWSIYFSDDNGYSWSSVAEKINKSQLEYIWTVPEIQTPYAKIKIIQDNRIGIDYESVSGKFKISGVINGSPAEQSLSEYILYPAYPNPFNTTTKISFLLPASEHVELYVYNSAGEKVETLINEDMPGGFHSLSWNADGLTSGIYFYSLRAGNFSRTRKAVLIK